MATTETLEDPLVLVFAITEHEFDVPCEGRIVNPEFREPCDSPAEWVVLFACGHTRMWCDEHLMWCREQENLSGFICGVCERATKILLTDRIDGRG